MYLATQSGPLLQNGRATGDVMDVNAAGDLMDANPSVFSSECRSSRPAFLMFSFTTMQDDITTAEARDTGMQSQRLVWDNENRGRELPTGHNHGFRYTDSDNRKRIFRQGNFQQLFESAYESGGIYLHRQINSFRMNTNMPIRDVPVS